MTLPLAHFYNPENFNEVCDEFSSIAWNYLQKAVRGEMPVLPVKKPEEMMQIWADTSITPQGISREKGVQLLDRVIQNSIHIHHPRYMGHQVTGPLPLAILCDMVMSMLNNSSAVYEMGQVAAIFEKKLIEWVCQMVGYASTSGGVITSGGSAGNLTALLAARQVKCTGDVWKNGFSKDEPKPAILVSSMAHYCIKRAVQMMGMGEGGAIAVAVDDEYRMDMNAMKEAYKRAEGEGRKVIAIAASACTTPTGTYDPLVDIADFCESNQLWMHVDGAHGLASLLSPKYKHLLNGVERADSVIWDLHKMLLMPSLITAVLYKRNEDSYQAFAQEASYLFNNPEVAEYNYSLRTLECTKPNVPLKAYISLTSYGSDAFGDYITSRNDLAKYFAQKLKEAPDFSLAVEPDCNIVCFRYEPEDADTNELDALQCTIRAQILDSGDFYLVQTKLHDTQYLRVTLINPLTKEEDIDALMAKIREVAQPMLKQAA